MEALLKNLGYQLITDFSAQDQKRFMNCLSLDKLYVAIFEPRIYVKIYEQVIETRSSDDGSTMWKARLSIGSFVLLDKDMGLTIDFFSIPLRPFRIRNDYEIDELDKLLGFIQIDFSQIKRKQEQEMKEMEMKSYDA